MKRRDFIRNIGVLGASAALVPAPARAAKTHELVTVLDLSKCIGCEECVYACREANGHKYPEPEKPFPEMLPRRVKVEDFSGKRDVADRLTPYNWLTIQRAEVEYRGRVHEVNIPRRCMHCRNAPCANLCPWGAARREANGTVRIETDVCLGGAKCRTVCPWKIPQRQTGVGLYLKLLPRFAGNGVMYKCDRCFERVGQGKVPACVEVCPEGVQTIGPRDEMVAKAKALAAGMDGFLYGLDENGGTNTIYVSPVPFELLNTAVEKGPGKPHLKPVANAMAVEDRMAWAVLAAPVAGVLGGVLKLGKKLTDTEAGHGDHD